MYRSHARSRAGTFSVESESDRDSDGGPQASCVCERDGVRTTVSGRFPFPCFSKIPRGGIDPFVASKCVRTESPERNGSGSRQISGPPLSEIPLSFLPEALYLQRLLDGHGESLDPDI